jgi:hypothetical protein
MPLHREVAWHYRFVSAVQAAFFFDFSYKLVNPPQFGDFLVRAEL